MAVEVTAPQFDAPWAQPGGIWQPVSIKHSGNVRISRARVLCSEASETRGVLTCSTELDATHGCEVTIRTFVTSQSGEHPGTDHAITRRLAAGANRLSWQVTVDEPDLWWTWSQGNQAFFDVVIEVTDTQTTHQISDSTKLRTAFRHVDYDNGYTFVNGQRVFMQSIESGNDGTLPMETDRAYFEEAIFKRRDAGSNLLVRNAWVEPQAFYDVADELGMLVWQGVPGGERAPHPRNVRQMIESLGHHPSVALWLRPQKRIRDRRPVPDSIKRTFDKGDPTRDNIELPLAWDLRHLGARDLLAIVPKWAKRSRFLCFTGDPREAAAQVEALRLLKYKPLGGYVAPLAVPELLGGAANLIRLVALPQEPLTTDEPAAIDVYVVNDSHQPLEDLTLEACSKDGETRWQGQVGADSVAFIGTFKAYPTESAYTVTLSFIGSELDERVVQLPVKRSQA